ncbi:MAG: hypothetical protein JW954_02030 [Dehalococcoidaceae bacterium]|nr:hypothetical protein [Dehalococcoidaceae bacterium]
MAQENETPKPVKEQKQAANTTEAPPQENSREHLNLLEKTVAEKEKQIDKLKTSAGSYQEDLNRLTLSLEKAVASYRNMVIKAHPDVPEELITGKSVDEIDSSLERAKKIVDRVRKTLEQPAVQDSVPAGAPPRNRDTAAGLSAREKIQYAIGGNY